MAPPHITPNIVPPPKGVVREHSLTFAATIGPPAAVVIAEEAVKHWLAVSCVYFVIEIGGLDVVEYAAGRAVLVRWETMTVEG
jgi:hypothetical protein